MISAEEARSLTEQAKTPPTIDDDKISQMIENSVARRLFSCHIRGKLSSKQYSELTNLGYAITEESKVDLLFTTISWK